MTKLVASAIAAVAIPLLSVACGSTTGDDGADAAPPALRPTYWTDVEPIFYTHCEMCHTVGGIGPFAIDDPLTASEYAGPIVAKTADRSMPPWPPGGDTPPLEHARTLTQDQIDVIAAWAAAGAPIGDPAQRGPLIEPEVVDIGPTELGFDIGTDYIPDPALTDDYRCFLADTGATSLRMATGYKVTPGNAATVHHVIIGQFAGTDRAALEALDAETPDRPGWPCVGSLVPPGTATEVGSLGSWVPGVTAVAYPPGTGAPIVGGSLAVIQVHYNLHGGLAPDRTRVDIALAPPEDNATLIRLGAVGLRKGDLYIPAGEPSVIEETSMTVAAWRASRGLPPFASGHGYVLGAGGHMHLIGTRIVLTRRNASGDTVLLDIPRWSFHWQGGYTYVTPIEIANDDTLVIRCEYDNTDEHRIAQGLEPGLAVEWGEGTTDEMCLGSLRVVETLP